MIFIAINISSIPNVWFGPDVRIPGNIPVLSQKYPIDPGFYVSTKNNTDLKPDKNNTL